MPSRTFIVSGKPIHAEGTGNAMRIDGQGIHADSARLADGSIHVRLGNQGFLVTVSQGDDPKTFRLTVNGKTIEVGVRTKLDDLLHRMGLDTANEAKIEDLKAPMPGLVVKILVEPGEQIVKGTPLIILEAMKMENILRATGPANVSAIPARQGKPVEKGEVLIKLG